MFGLSSTDLLIILLVFLFFFGGRALPSIAKGTGDVIRVTWKEINKIVDKV